MSPDQDHSRYVPFWGDVGAGFPSLRDAGSTRYDFECERMTFDLIYSMGTIEHFPDYEVAARETFRALKPRGTAIIGVPNKLDPFLRPLLAAEVAESRTLLSQLVAVVQLYRALGGGWDALQVTEKVAGGS